MAQELAKQMVEENKGVFLGDSLSGIKLLKQVVDVSKVFWERVCLSKAKDSAPMPIDEGIWKRAVLRQNFEGVEEYGKVFHVLVQAAGIHQDITRYAIQLVLQQRKGSTGFSAFEEVLLDHCLSISRLYHPFYTKYLASMGQGNDAFAEAIKADPPKGDLLSPYTVLGLKEGGGYSNTPYAVFFAEELRPILAEFDAFAQSAGKLEGLTEDEGRYVTFMAQYRAALAEEDISKLEAANSLLDEKWVAVRHRVQVVHDIEAGYGEPLRCKSIPDFSLRFLDPDYDEANATIADIQTRMVKYFEGRKGKPLADNGLSALSSSMAGLYFIPVQTGMSLHFRFAGQSIPNREEVKGRCGVKIYFDPVAAGSRLEQTKDLVRKVVVEDQREEMCQVMDPIESLIWHVAAHEVGHAIYNLEALGDNLAPDTKTLMEEPRAELTGLSTMLLLHKQGVLSESRLQDELCSFALQDLRRYSMFTNSATRPYTISAINTYKLHLQTGFMSWDKEAGVRVDRSKAVASLELLTKQFETVLDAEDAMDGAKITKMCDEFAEETDYTRWLVEKLS